MIEVKHITKSFGNRAVIEDINIVFERGKPNLIIGASGSGKTTLTKCMVGLTPPDTGEILYDGVDFASMTDQQKKDIRIQIGFLFQGSALFDSMTVEDNVKFPLKVFSKQTAKEMQDRADFCLDRVDLSDAKKLYPSELSGGMKKRVGIARAISMNPKYLFCDEPNSGLDPLTSSKIDNLIAEITNDFNITTVVITHDMNSVIEIGERINFIYKGKLSWKGTKQEILKTTVPEVVEFVYSSKHMQALRK